MHTVSFIDQAMQNVDVVCKRCDCEFDHFSMRFRSIALCLTEKKIVGKLEGIRG